MPCRARVNVPSEPCPILGLDFGSRSLRKSCSSWTHTATVCSPSLLHAAQSLCALLEDQSEHLLDEMTPAVRSANHSTFSLRNPLWNGLDSVPGRVKPLPTCFSYTLKSPPPEFHDWALKVFHAAADFSPDFVHAHDQHQGDSDIQTNFGRKSTTKTITQR